MLVRLFGHNFRSFKGEFELSLVAADLTREEDRARGIIEVPIRGAEDPLRLVRCVALYGANASGKSTVLTASRALRWLGTDSSTSSKPGESIPPYEPFLLDEKSCSAPIRLGCDFVSKDKLLRYEITYDASAIQEESLSILDDNGATKLIDRMRSGEVRGELITNSRANKLYVKEMQPNVSVLSKLAQHGPHKGKESVQRYYAALRNATRSVDFSNATQFQVNFGSLKDERFADDENYREWIMSHLIRAADVGICDVKAHREQVTLPDELRELLEKAGHTSKLPDTRVVVSFVHEGSSQTPIEFSAESSGTKKLFNIAAEWWRLANETGTLLADELSASLHPKLLDRIVRSVNEASGRSQLIFTTHDTGLLESQDGQPPVLRRDQVYFTSKNSNGASELYALAEFKEEARPVHNIRKRYLSGLYGSIPDVERLSL